MNGLSESTSCRMPTVNVVVGALDADAAGWRRTGTRCRRTRPQARGRRRHAAMAPRPSPQGAVHQMPPGRGAARVAGTGGFHHGDAVRSIRADQSRGGGLQWLGRGRGRTVVETRPRALGSVTWITQRLTRRTAAARSRPGRTGPAAGRQGPARAARVDDYAWLATPTTRDAARTCAAERAYYDARTAHTRPSSRRCSTRCRAATLPSDRSVSWSRGGLVYYTGTRRREGIRAVLQRSARKILRRSCSWTRTISPRAPTTAPSGLREPSPDGAAARLLGRPDGDEVYELRFRDLATGEDLPDDGRPAPTTAVPGRRTRGTFFYMVHDEAYRPYQVWRHELGTDPARRRPGPARSTTSGSSSIVRGVPVRRATS